MAEIKFDEKFVDPKTGETVTRVKCPENLLKEVDSHIMANSVAAQNFMQISRSIMEMFLKDYEEYMKATKSQNDMGKEVIKIREKMSLDSSWVFNIPLKMMEKREPPADTRTIGEGIATDK
jgi:hypothetical protein